MAHISKIQIDFTQVNKIYVFILFCVIALVLAYLGNDILVHDDLYFEYFGEQIAYERIVKFIDVNKEWRWVGYAILPVFYLLKFFLVASALFTGIILAGYKFSFKDLFYLAMLSELVFLITPVVKIFWFGIFFTDYTLQDLQYFSPLSLLSLLNRDSIEPWLAYPLQLFSLFEVIYWLLLAYGLYSLTNERYSKMLGLVATSYGVGLLVWTVFIVFLSVSIAP